MTPVLYLITEFDTGGAENTLFELASRLDRKKYSVSACCLTGRGEIGRKLSGAGVRVFYLGMKGKWDFTAFFRLICILRKENIKILHTFLFHANFIGRIAGRLAGVPAVVSSVRVSEREKKLHVLGERITALLADRILCVSGGVKKFMADAGIPEQKMLVVPNGIDLEKFRDKHDARGVKRELGMPEDAKVIGTVSRLSRQKRLDRFLDCARIILDERPEAYFVIAGRGPLERELKERARRLGIRGRVVFAGFRPDVLRLMSAFDVFILTSSWEGMPVSLLEAMASGLPCVVSAVEGSSEVVEEGASGFLVEPEDAAGYARRALMVLGDAKTRRRISAAASRRAGRYSVEAMVEKNERVYEGFFP